MPSPSEGAQRQTTAGITRSNHDRRRFKPMPRTAKATAKTTAKATATAKAKATTGQAAALHVKAAHHGWLPVTSSPAAAVRCNTVNTVNAAAHCNTVNAAQHHLPLQGVRTVTEDAVEDAAAVDGAAVRVTWSQRAAQLQMGSRWTSGRAQSSGNEDVHTHAEGGSHTARGREHAQPRHHTRWSATTDRSLRAGAVPLPLLRRCRWRHGMS